MVTDFRSGTVLENKVQDMIKEMGGLGAVLGKLVFLFNLSGEDKGRGDNGAT